MQTLCHIGLGEHEISYTLRKRRGQKRVKLSVRRDGSITLSVPWHVSARAAERYVIEKRDWLLRVLHSLPLGTHIPAVDRAAHYAAHKEEARRLVYKELTSLNAHYGFVWGRVAIRKNASSWGSCSSKKNLNFDYRILFLPSHLRMYLVVHELCHLREMNHSPRFWALVARVIPEYVKMRRELRKFGTGIT